MKRFILFSLMLFSLSISLTVGLAVAAPDREKDKPSLKLLPPLSKEIPETIEDLRAMEKQVQQVLDRVFPATVCVLMGGGSGSGVIVSPDGKVLTAGHVSRAPGGNCTLVLHDGRKVKAKALGRNGSIDSGMIQILDPGPFPYVEMGKSASMKVGQWCIGVGHPGGLHPNRGMVVRVGRVLFNSNSFIRTDCFLVGGDSGGPLFNMQGEVIGIHSRIGNKLMNENMHVPLDTFTQTWDRLVKGDAWGGILGMQMPVESANGKVVLEEKGKFTEKDPLDSRMKDSFFRLFTFKMVPGFAYTIDMKSPDVDSFLRLEDSDGKRLAENDDGGDKQDSRIVYRPSREGTYRIIATTFEGAQTGAYSLSVRQAEIVTKELPSGKVNVIDALKVPPANIRRALGKFGPEGVEVFANAHLFTEDGKPIAGKEATFVWRKGKQSSRSDDQGQVRVQLTMDMVDELTLEAPEGLRAMVRITDGEGTPLPLPPGKGGFPKKGK